MDIKSKQTVPMTFSLPKSSTPTTLTTPEASKHYFDYFLRRAVIVSRVRALRLVARCQLQPPSGTAAAVSC